MVSRKDHSRQKVTKGIFVYRRVLADMLLCDNSPSPPRVPNDYRPPSPTWVSRAGGVAIMKKKSY
jgi:hypothetical protein